MTAVKGDGRCGPVVVFLGPTLTAEDAARELDLDGVLLHPPIAQGDVVDAVANLGASALAIIDGVFRGQPAVRHKEILWALSRGVAVYGSSSMGALRAAELAGFGMVGVGMIYRWYRLTFLAADDAVALVHGPEEIGSPPVSRSLIDLRMTLRAARRAGVIDRALQQRLEALARETFYPERSLMRLVGRAAEAPDVGDPATLARLAVWAPTNAVEQKRIDALELLRRLSSDVRAGTLPQLATSLEFRTTAALAADLRAAGLDPTLLDV